MSGTKLKIMCLLWPDDKPKDHIVQVNIDDDDTVASLKKLIKDEHAHRLAHVDARDLVLWKCSIPANDNLQETLNILRFDGTEARLDRLAPASEISEHFPTSLPRKTIHILVEVPVLENEASPASLPNLLVQVPDAALDHPTELPVHLARSDAWSTTIVLSTVGGPSDPRATFLLLKSFWELEEPLVDSEKIPITDSMYTGLISMLLPDTCDDDDIGTLFKIGELDPNLLLFFGAASGPPPVGGTEDSFHSFWDDNIRKPIELLIPSGKTIRNGNQHTETRKFRPDFGFLLKKICPFRGEEKGPENSEDPKAELADKLNWVYDPAPYMLGYYCRGSEMTLVAITAPDSQGSKPKIHDLITLDLRWRKNRIANIRHLINLSTIIPRLTELVRSPVDDFELFERTNSTVEITSTLIVKTYTCENPEAKVKHLQRIYAVLAARHIPNTDALVFANKNVAHLSPRGIAGQPLVEKELRECVTCILESLIVAHQVPIYHRHIRWNNIIRRIEGHSKWFLIDWEDAAIPPTRAEPSFKKSTHSPAIFVDGHGAEVDVWSVGYLIKTCTAADVSTEMKALGVRICQESHMLNAQAVLALVNPFPYDSA